MEKTTLKVGVIGNCPVCEGDFKTHGGSLVHHGYKRPGDGMIHGDCFAVGYEPYEKSTVGCVDYKARLELNLASLKAFLVEIPNRTYWSETQILGWNNIRSKDFALGVTNLYDWERLVENKIRDTEFQIRGCTSEIERMEKRIAAWVPKELRVVTEEYVASVVKAEREARAAEKAAKNAAKDAKAAALKAKRVAKAEAVEKAFVAFIEELRSLDAMAPESEKLARDAWEKFFSLKNHRLLGSGLQTINYEFRKRNLDALLLSLGLATISPGGWVSYKYSI